MTPRLAMPATPDNHDYAERIRERLLRRLQERHLHVFIAAELIEAADRQRMFGRLKGVRYECHSFST